MKQESAEASTNQQQPVGRVNKYSFLVSSAFISIAVMAGPIGAISRSRWLLIASILVAASMAVQWHMAASGKHRSLLQRLILAAAGGWLAAQPLINNYSIPASPTAWVALAAVWLAGAAALAGIIAAPRPDDDTGHFPKLAPSLVLSAGLVLLPVGLLWFPHGVWATLGAAPGFFFSICALIAMAVVLVALNPRFNRPAVTFKVFLALIFLSSVVLCGRVLAATLLGGGN
jgi:hypothetical protein